MSRAIAAMLCMAISVLVLTGSGVPAVREAAANSFAVVSTSGAPVSNGPAPPSSKVTLITGDLVSVERSPAGQYNASVEAAPRPSGLPVSFETLRSPEGGLYVFPSDAEAYLAAGLLDPELFNVAYLVKNGYGDRGGGSLPVIVEYSERLGASAELQRARDLPASNVTHVLESINAVSLNISQGSAEDFWPSLTGKQGEAQAATKSPSLEDGLTKVWLDRRVEVDLNESVPQIGAPDAWAAGYDGSGVTVAVLDTGIDATHPDLVGNVAASRSFIPGQSVADGHGHGTHVASIVAGTGAASEGRYRGVAPGAQLVVGKVLNDTGSGTSSQIIDGMEWAALEQGAEVVSMSLGSNQPGDGLDPMSLAVDELTESTGGLFVIAAGNDGPRAQTVTSPGAAAAALTVGAVDKSDALASFSGRGPLIRTLALKPDITAPGVDIAAARAAGTSRGTPIDQWYTRLSGTSMATPHVAGAAAILAQQHPGWTAVQLKAALAASAHGDDYINPYEQGVGRVDVAGAIDQTLQASPTNLDFGAASGQASRTITVTNYGADSVTMTLAADIRDPNGDPASHLVTIDSPTLAVPGGGSAEVTATFNPPANAPLGGYSGLVRALDADGEVLRLAFGAFHEPPKQDLTLRSIPPDEWPNFITELGASWRLVRVDAPQDVISVGRAQTEEIIDGVRIHSSTVRVPEGVYMVWVTYAFYPKGEDEWTEAILVDPEVVVDQPDREVVIDGRQAKALTVRTPRPAQPTDYGIQLVRDTLSTGSWVVLEQGHPQKGSGGNFLPNSLRVTPTAPVTTGGFRFVAGYDAIEPRFTMDVLGRGAPTALRPVYPDYFWSTPQLDRHGTVDLVNVGTASVAEIQQARVRGRLALYALPELERPPACRPSDLREPSRLEALRRIQDAGAIAVIAFKPFEEGGPQPCNPGHYGSPEYQEKHRFVLPVLTVGRRDGQELSERARRGAVRIRLDATSQEAYSYHARFEHPDRVPDVSSLAIPTHKLVTVESSYHGDMPAWSGGGWRSWDSLGIAVPGIGRIAMRSPVRRTEYVYPATPDLLWEHHVETQPVTSAFSLNSVATQESSWFVFDRAGRRDEHWLAPPTTPGSARLRPAVRTLLNRWQVNDLGGLCICRGPHWLATFRQDVAGEYRLFEPYLLGQIGGVLPGTETHLYRDGQEIPPVALLPGLPAHDLFDAGLLPSDPSRYRLTQRTQAYVEQPQRFPREVNTSWDFTSRAPGGGESPPLLICLDQAFADPAASCRAEPLLFLGYELGDALDLNNSAPAPGTARFRVQVYQQDGAPRSKVGGFDLRISFDSGEHWQKSKKVKARGDGRFEVTIKHPKLSQTGGTVSLRVEAWDDAGNRVQQTVLDAYGLRGSVTPS